MTSEREQKINENINRLINSSNDISQLIEIKKLFLEEQKNNREDELKRQEIELKKEEIELRKEENRLKDKQSKFPNSILSNPATTAIIAAFAGFLTSSLVALIQGNSDLQLEQLKFQSNLIAKATESADLNKRKESLRFYIDAGLIKDSYIISKLDNLITSGEIPQFANSRQSYQLTCRNIQVQGDVLYATCARVDGQWNTTYLENFKDCEGVIENIDGSLQCNKQR